MMEVMPPLHVRVAMRHSLKTRRMPDVQRVEGQRYTRLIVVVNLPSDDKYLNKLLSTAARASDTIPFIRHQGMLEVTLDLPVDLDQRKQVMQAVQSLPFVESVVAKVGPPVNRGGYPTP